MVAAAFFSWWYGPGWTLVLKNMRRRIQQTEQMFSVSVLLRTLFAPWHRIITYPGASMADHMRAMSDNLVSRMVGFTVRLFVIIAAVLTLTFVVIVAFVEIVAWPLIPIATVGGIIEGLL